MAQALLAALTIAWVLATPAQATVGVELQAPDWKHLSGEQKQVLAPLSGEWDQLDQTRRKKWLGIAKRYPAMTPDEQDRLQRRMKSWAQLSVEERQRARTRYKQLQGIEPAKKESLRERWTEYDSLPDEEKQRLKAQSRASRTGKPLTGAGQAQPGTP